MAQRNREGWSIPDVIDPPESMRVEICIPKNVTHMKAFWGALWELTFWNNWEPDAAHSGTLVAHVWERYYLSWQRQMNELPDCEGNVNCCEPLPVLHRIDPVTGYPQVSYDNGETWKSDPNSIQSQITVLPPLVHEGSTSTKCDAATNASEHVNELITATGENLETASTVFALAVGIAEAILALFLILISAGTLAAPVTAVATAIWAAATSLFNLGISAYNAYWTVDKQDAILCALYCNIGDNGQFTEEQYQSFRAKVKGQLPASPALDIVMTSINAGGAVGLSQMASYGNAAEADCSSCSCSCDPTSWTVTVLDGVPVGTILSYGTNYVIVRSVAHPSFGGLTGEISIQTNDDNVCCQILPENIEFLTGEVNAEIATFDVDCGSPRYPASSLTAWDGSTSSNSFQMRKGTDDTPIGTQFDVKISFI